MVLKEGLRIKPKIESDNLGLSGPLDFKTDVFLEYMLGAYEAEWMVVVAR